MKTIIVTGSVGSGKTRLSKSLAKHLKYKYVDVTKLIKDKSNCLYDDYDKENKCFVVNEKKFVEFMKKFIETGRKKSEKGLVIDSHLAQMIPKKYVDLCIVTKCDLKILRERLKRRGYSEKKIMDNLEAEIFNICFDEAKEKKHKILVIDSSCSIGKEAMELINL